MRTRFKKVWCGSCASMQFAGECPHGRELRPRLLDRADALEREKFGGGSGITEINDGEALRLVQQRELFRQKLRDQGRRCSCAACSVGAPCLNLVGA